MTNSRRIQRHPGILGWTLLAACVFSLEILAPNPASAQPTYTVIHNFSGGEGGLDAQAGLVIDHAGNLYGTTDLGGPANGCCGIVFELNPSTRVFTKLWQFTGGSDGAAPQAPLLIGPGGALYGSTAFGGAGNCNGGCGVVFSLVPPVTPPHDIQENHWIENVLYSFQGSPSDGSDPYGDLATDHLGNIYGTTLGGGTVFKLTYSNGSWRESILHRLNWPTGGVTLDAAGNVYGTTRFGGASGSGTVYQLLAGSGWAENILYSFPSGNPYLPGSVTFDSSGNLYGTTANGPGLAFGGTAFELSAGSWSYNLLYTFSGHSFGCGPSDKLIFDQAGNLYGTTACDGAYNYGSVFKLTPSNGTWTYTSLHDFTGGSDGGYPIGDLVFDPSGNLYGVTDCGGSTGNCAQQHNSGYGVVFKVTP